MKLMTFFRWVLGSVFCALVSSGAEVSPPDVAPVETAPAPPDPYTQEIQAWQAQRLQTLTKPDGWLTLIGVAASLAAGLLACLFFFLLFLRQFPLAFFE